MTEALWAFDALVRAAGGIAEGAPSRAITGFSIDTRALQPGDVFVALTDARDGHDFVTTAFKAGAAAAIVSETYARHAGDGALIRVSETLRALEAVGRAARARLSLDARVFAVTGSVGKTTTKEMLRACCERLGQAHASDKSFNNHWGVPLTLARMPADTRYAVFEIGMNHAGEIAPLTRMVRPHIAIVTTVEAAHIEHFPNEEAIAEAKAEIFLGLEPGGTAVLNADNRHFARLRNAAQQLPGIRVIAFSGTAPPSSGAVRVGLTGADTLDGMTRVRTSAGDYVLGSVGHHMVMNSMAVMAALHAAGANVPDALRALATLQPPSGRGSRLDLPVEGGSLLLIDESYNANPASMRAALAALATVPRKTHPRRLAVLGDMLELGSQAPDMHADLFDSVDAAGVDLVFAAGPNMQHLFERVPTGRQGGWASNSKGIEAQLLAAVRSGDVVMIKGSNGSRMAPLVEALKVKFTGGS